ncbi:MAG: UDP-N-acetylmuramoyl-L-alanyl-D-glutamate--2,6-diaminopimelate ligase [Elusimicrobia bacterium RIFOXYB2_FULL_49_7]|nr:MAG: UDP-N-acetylmuramoyl-L-alanyl-D-glutamate--2,6-diaminopimelate ligase [Elusimicrobia bacterium RIFOXYB2_FULL_49_7]
MKLTSLLHGIDCTLNGPQVQGEQDIKGIAYDSRLVKPGFLFIALAGHHTDGNKFVNDALAAGATAVMSQEKLTQEAISSIVVENPLAAMAQVSSRFYGHPDKNLLMIGITGTNGKTTITYLMESILNRAGLPAGVLGTINYRYGEHSCPAPNTTPQSADVYRILSDMVKHEQKSAVLEVSSHALSLGRVSGIEFDCALFTNLTRDHLDFHHTMEEYFQAKAKLFTNLAPGKKSFPKFAIINTDDQWGKTLAGLVRQATVVTYGIHGKPQVRAEYIRSSSKGTEFVLVAPQGHRKVHLQLLGQHNVYNALASAACALSAGIPLETVVEGLEKAPHVPGRLEKVEAGQPFTVVVDYAHTDDALMNVLTALKKLSPSRLITVFGCGGDRDRSKRPLMGEAATAQSDFVFVTSDNPRSENPDRIALDIEVGIRRQHRNNYQVILDREQAIATAIHMARKGDIVLIAGKGHETYQIIGDQKIHFNDTEIARKYLRDVHKHNVAI